VPALKTSKMENEIKLIKNNDKRTDSDIEKVQEFYAFLKGTLPDNITLVDGHQPILTDDQAFSIIWYLQEHLSVFPDGIEKCSICGDLYDSYSEGYYSEIRNLFMCSGCDDGLNDDSVEDSAEEFNEWESLGRKPAESFKAQI